MTAAQPDAETRITRLEQRCARLSYALLATVALVATAVAWGCYGTQRPLWLSDTY
jgi:hypothetical protein